jgi:hypothetical protein
MAVSFSKSFRPMMASQLASPISPLCDLKPVIEGRSIRLFIVLRVHASDLAGFTSHSFRSRAIDRSD